jgi:hypothetical protein
VVRVLLVCEIAEVKVERSEVTTKLLDRAI